MEPFVDTYSQPIYNLLHSFLNYSKKSNPRTYLYGKKGVTVDQCTTK